MERVDPNVPTEDVAGMFAEVLGLLAVNPIEHLHQPLSPRSAVLDHTDAQAGEALEHPVRAERRERVENVASLFVAEPAKLGDPEPLELVAAYPVVAVAVVAGVRVVHLHRDSR